MKHIIIDFDNTMGVRGCDVDDGLALLYLIGNPDCCTIHGACTAYGNSDIDTVDANTRRLFTKLGLDIPVLRGAAGPGQRESEAARFLAETCASDPGHYSVLVTGSTTNLLGAAQIDPQFFQNVADLTFMGGVTHSLVINGRIMDELNLSCDPDATLAAFASGASVTVATAQHCLPAHITREALARAFDENAWLTRTIDYWFSDMGKRYTWDGFAVWDQVAAAMLIKPELFEDETFPVALDRRFLSIGYLERASEHDPQALIHTPTIADQAAYLADALECWRRACDLLGV